MSTTKLLNALDRAGAKLTDGCATCKLSRRSFLTAATAAVGTSLLDSRIAAAVPNNRSIHPVIDFHAHMADKALQEKSGGFRQELGIVQRLLEPAGHLEDMDRYGIDKQVITMANAIQGISWGDARHDLEIHRRLNDEIADAWVGRYPQRFIGSFTLPLQDLDLSLNELDRCASQLKSKVVQLSSVTPDGVYMGDPKMFPFWEEIHRRGLIAFIHPHGNATDPPMDRYWMFNSIGQGIEEAKVMGSIIYEGLFERFPGVRIVVAHGGGFLPHDTGRMDRNVTAHAESAKNLSRKPSSYIKNFYFDSCVYSPDILDALVKIVGSDRIVLGGDYPVGEKDIEVDIRTAKTLTADDVNRILSRNAVKLLAIA